MSEYHGSISSVKEPRGGKPSRISGWLLSKLAAEAEERFIPPKFKSVSDMCMNLNLPGSKFALGWRLTEVRVGEIVGLPKSRGFIVATDGMLCIILQPTGHYIGHVKWFTPDEVEESEVASELKKASRMKLVENIDSLLME